MAVAQQGAEFVFAVFICAADQHFFRDEAARRQALWLAHRDLRAPMARRGGGRAGMALSAPLQDGRSAVRTPVREVGREEQAHDEY